MIRPSPFLACATLILTILVPVSATTAGPIVLPTNGITKLGYTGYETFHDVNGNGVVDAGDNFDGIFQLQSITNPAGTVDLSGQLGQAEITGSFLFTVIGGSSTSGHIEFGLPTGNFFSLFVGQGATKNYDPSAPDAVARATDGLPWFSIQSGTFFESVNDVINGAPLNRAWMNYTSNNTGYTLASEPFPTLLGEDPTHTYMGVTKGDNIVQVYFENSSARSDLPGYTFKINGPIYLQAVPAPPSIVLGATGLLGLAKFARRRRSPIPAR
jgi:hypothetical protein